MFTGCRREYHPEAQTSQKVTNKFAKEPPEKNNHIQLKQGWILRIQKFREGIDLWLLCANLLLNVLYHIYVRMKIRESRLQNGSFIYKMGISLTKQDFKLQKETLGLQTGLSDCYLPCDTDKHKGKTHIHGIMCIMSCICFPSFPIKNSTGTRKLQ